MPIAAPAIPRALRAAGWDSSTSVRPSCLPDQTAFQTRSLSRKDLRQCLRTLGRECQCSSGARSETGMRGYSLWCLQSPSSLDNNFSKLAFHLVNDLMNITDLICIFAVSSPALVRLDLWSVYLQSTHTASYMNLVLVG